MENQYLNIVRESRSGNFIVSVTIGDHFQNKWNTTCMSNWFKYCDRYDIGLVLLHSKIPSDNKNIYWQKYLIGSELQKYREINKICYLDYDILINPLATDIFEIVDPDCINIVSQEQNLPYRDEPTLIKRNIAYYRKEFLNKDYPLNSSLLLNAREAFKTYGLTPFDNYACMGVFAYNHKIFQSRLTETALSYSGSEDVLDVGDELLINHELQKNYPINWLNYEWQTLWIFEVATKYNYLYTDKFECEDANRRAIEACLVSCSFLHFAGSWEGAAFDSIKNPISEESYDNYERLLAFRKKVVIPKLRGRLLPNMTNINKHQ